MISTANYYNKTILGIISTSSNCVNCCFCVCNKTDLNRGLNINATQQEKLALLTIACAVKLHLAKIIHRYRIT